MRENSLRVATGRPEEGADRT